MKSITRRPLEYRPFGLPKNDWPLGGSGMANALAVEPVSEFESPKLNIAGQSQVSNVKTGFKGRAMTKNKGKE